MVNVRSVKMLIWFRFLSEIFAELTYLVHVLAKKIVLYDEEMQKGPFDKTNIIGLCLKQN